MGISRLQTLLAEVVQKFEGRLNTFEGTGTIIRLDHAFLHFPVMLLPEYAGRIPIASWMIPNLHQPGNIIKSICKPRSQAIGMT